MKHPSETTIGWVLTQVARLHRLYLNEKLAEIGLFAGQEQVLQGLDTQDAITMGELANSLRVRMPTASKAVTRLAALGLVERQSDGGDRRMVRVRLTRKGKAAAVRMHVLWDEVESDLVAGFALKESTRLRTFLLRAASSLATALSSTEQDFDNPLDASDDHHV